MFGYSDRIGNESDLAYNMRKYKERQIWNDALEAAARMCDYPDTVEKIRKLKK